MTALIAFLRLFASDADTDCQHEWRPMLGGFRKCVHCGVEDEW